MKLHPASKRNPGLSTKRRTIQHGLGILAAMGLLVLESGCASTPIGGASATCDRWEYNPRTGYPAIGGAGHI